MAHLEKAYNNFNANRERNFNTAVNEMENAVDVLVEDVENSSDDSTTFVSKILNLFVKN